MAATIASIAPTSGPVTGGTEVTATGAGFAAGLLIQFNGTPVAATVDSGTQARAVAPAHAVGVVDVSVSFLEAHAVVGLVAVAGDGSADLSWSAPDNAIAAGVTGYHIVVSPGGATADVGGTSTTISGLADGTLYAFTVSAVNGGGLGVAASTTATPVDTTAPTVNTFTVGAPSDLVVPVTAFTSTDNVGVVKWKITTSSTPPSWASMAGSAPTDWTAGADGTYSLYPWVGDGAGNVSAVFGSPRSVTVTAVLTYTEDFAGGTLSGFTVVSGTWANTSSKARCTSGSGVDSILRWDAPGSFQDGALEAIINNATRVGEYVSLILRYVDVNNYVQVYFTWATTNASIHVGEQYGGVFTETGLFNWPGGQFATGTDYHIRFEASAKKLRVLVDGVEKIAWTTDMPHAAWSGKAAFKVYPTSNSADTKLDDLLATY